jgi:protein AIR1/2
MDWNSGAKGSLRTSLRGGGRLGQNRLASGFRLQPEPIRNGQAHVPNVVEISDDSEMEDDSEGGILLNVGASSNIESSVDLRSPVDVSDGEDGEIADISAHKPLPLAPDGKVVGKPPAPNSHQAAALQDPSPVRSKLTSPMVQVDAHRGARILADLNPEDLENQIKYTLFHLPRHQIDLSRPVICLACLSEGHVDQYCTGVLCSDCGSQTKHSSRLCPSCARCPKCGDRGHSVDACTSKLKNINLEPCEFCGGADHVEASCTQRFFPARTERPAGELQLWMSCAQCGSKNHLAGDCPAFARKAAHAWSLRTYDRDKIVNLSLHTGAQAREKEAQNKGLRPEGMQIKGRGTPSNNKYPKRGEPAKSAGLQFEDDDDFTTRIAHNRPRRHSPPRNHNRTGNGDRGRTNRDSDDDFYRPRSNGPGSSNGYDSYHPPPSHEYRDRNGYEEGRRYQEDRGYHGRRLRSRSPPRFDGDTWRPPPPLPRGRSPNLALPSRPAQPRGNQQSQDRAQNFSKKAKRGGGKAKGGAGKAAVRPMPSAAKKAWQRGRS